MIKLGSLLFKLVFFKIEFLGDAVIIMQEPKTLVGYWDMLKSRCAERSGTVDNA